MRRIRTVKTFRRDLKRVLANPKHRDVDRLLSQATDHLAADLPLPKRYSDHALLGEWLGARDCHLKSDLVLVYRKSGSDLLELLRIGSHSELFRK